MTENEDIAVETRGLSKNYGTVTALASVDLKIPAGEYFVLLGPSGGGKTTLLRLLGGFIRPSAGTVLLHGRDVSDMPPDRRPTSMVFQNFALFPHMSVARNVGYGLRLRKLAAGDVRKRVGQMLDLIGLGELSERMPHELSGGQQQRVQLARSLVLETDIPLLDEPLAALDAKLRKEMCIELKRLQETVGITFVHVTHNQEEAMTVADNLAVIAGGELVEVGRARALYENPRKRFTADFVGENNLFDGRVTAVYGERVQVDVGFATIIAGRREQSVETGDQVALSIRSELVHIHATAEAVDMGSIQVLDGEFQRTVYLGLTISDLVRLPDGRDILARRLADSNPQAEAPAPGDKLRIGWRMDDVRLHLD